MTSWLKKFGEDIAILIDGVTKIGKLKFKGKIEEETENFRKMVRDGKDVRVVLVKLADRLHNMRNMGPMKPHKRKKKKSEETMEIFVPKSQIA